MKKTGTATITTEEYLSLKEIEKSILKDGVCYVFYGSYRTFYMKRSEFAELIAREQKDLKAEVKEKQDRIKALELEINDLYKYVEKLKKQRSIWARLFS